VEGARECVTGRSTAAAAEQAANLTRRRSRTERIASDRTTAEPDVRDNDNEIARD